MTASEIVARVKILDLPDKSYIVFGSCPMAIAGLREANDIDMLVSKEVFEMLQSRGWQVVVKGPGDAPLMHDVFEAHPNWDFSTYSPTLDHLLKSANFVDGVPFAALREVRKWKASSGRPKDLADITLIDAYFVSKSKHY